MTIFDLLALIGGLALFLYGMQVMGSSLEKQAGGRFKSVLEKITSNPLSGLLLGTGITGIIQSSSATTVMVVGLVNSGIMTLEHSVGVIMGANIGTTVTAWILSLVGIEGDNLLVSLLKPSSFTPILAIIGVGIMMFSKSDRKKNAALVMLGFTVLMFGMQIMSDSVAPLQNDPNFTSVLLLFSNPIFGILVGLFVTCIIQSSSASIGILQAMSLTGSVTFSSALPIMLGMDIGTCITAILSSIGTSANARRAALVHLYFNVIGVTVFATLFYVVHSIVGFGFYDMPVGPLEIAITNSIFKIINTAAFMPFRNTLVWLSKKSVREEPTDERFNGLDERFLGTPGFAVTQCRNTAVEMAKLSRDTLFSALDALYSYSEPIGKQILENEEYIDQYEDKLGSYLVKLSSRNMSEEDSHEVSKLMHCIGDFERISDHAVNIMETSEEMHQKNISFSDEARAEIAVMTNAVQNIVTMAIQAFANNDMVIASHIEPIEEVIDLLKVQLKVRHIARLQRGECTIILGFVFSDLITNCERIADHCSNIGAAVLQNRFGNYESHEFLNTLKTSDNEEFLRLYNEYLEKYKLT